MKWVSERRFLHFIEDIKNIFARKDEVPSWAKQPEKPIYTASEVGADASGTAESKLSVHNTATDSHNDIRLLIEGLTTCLNALADSDDTTLDQMSEVVAYVKSNKSLIDAITTSKVSVTDIVDNLTTNAANKPLSAAQGVALKALIDAITTVELDETLTDNTKAAPANVVGKLKVDVGNLSEEISNLVTAAGNIPSNTETFTFTLKDGTEVVKEVYVKT